MKRQRAQSIHNFFKPIGSSSQPCEHDAHANDVQSSGENHSSPAEVDVQTDQDVPVPKVTQEPTIMTTKYDREPG